jgi:hypothetical protein
MFHNQLRKNGFLVAVSLTALGVSAASASAGSLVLGDSGWTASWDSSADSFLGLNVDGVSSSTVFLEKGLNYTAAANSDGTFDPVTITFQQTSADALPFIAINDEAVSNNSGSDWSGFRFTLANAAFDTAGSRVGQSGGFSIDPFTNHVFSSGDTVLDVSGATVADGQVWFPGIASGNLLVIAPHGADSVLPSFSLGEMPIGGGSTPPAIPLPPAFWSGLIGLGGLGLIGAGRRVRKLK